MNKNALYSQSYINHLNSLIVNRFNHLCSIHENFSLTLQGISRLVMLDRYSQKDKERKTLQVGDIVLTVIKSDPKFPARGVGKIVDRLNENGTTFWTIKIEKEFENNIDSDLIYKKSEEQNGSRTIIKQTFEIEKPLELFYEQIA